MKKLYRSNQQRMLLGVCGGIAERFDVDVSLVRLAFVLLLFTGPGLLVYLAAAIVIPRNPALPAAPDYRALGE